MGPEVFGPRHSGVVPPFSPRYAWAIVSALPDEGSAQELWDEVQQRQLDEGGYIVWAYQNIVDAAAPNRLARRGAREHAAALRGLSHRKEPR